MQKWRTKRDFVLDEMRQAIVSGEFPPGFSLSLEELAGRYGVSLTPIREALRELEADGLVVSEPHKGAFVRRHTIEDAYQVFTIRSALEAMAARLAVPNLTRHDLQAFKENMAQMEAGFAANDLTRARDANREFHYRIYRLAGWPRLEEIMRNLWLQSPWSMLRILPGRTQRSIEEHDEILSALEARQTDKVEELLQAHVLNAREELVRHFGNPVALGDSAISLEEELDPTDR